jgi:hypothetical protein
MLAACNDSDNPRPAPLPTTTTEKSTTPTPPPLPPTANGTSNASAEAFVRHFIETLNFAITTGDTGPVRRLSTEKCSSCKGVADYLDGIYSAGGNVATSGWQVKRLKFLARSPDGEPTFHAAILQPVETTVASPSAKPSESTEATKFFFVYVEHTDKGWRISEFELTKDNL